MEEITIHIYASDEGGYKYDIYKAGLDEAAEGVDSYDGGHCTGRMIDALGMAMSQAEDTINSEKGDECIGCGVDMSNNNEGRKAVSRYGHGDICPACGTREALEGNFIGAR